ncbi:hypothetical protein SLEP1_g29694 [Rubroshorea leprosula]|uniref:C2H2-type domain-containing protein n=1 Tax=Rubroshorea leprosula TaxID=152421 RepID=A0AAV5JXS2_9ROSI|nr:hypothetical protein SLEP1_g29694 [Rubroshorea leprosula]
MNPFNGNREDLKSTVIYCWRCGKESKNLEESGEHQDAHNRGKVQPPVNEAKAKARKARKARTRTLSRSRLLPRKGRKRSRWVRKARRGNDSVYT